MSAARRGRDTSSVMSDVDIAANAAALGAKESPEFKEKLDDIWGTESQSSEDLENAINAGEEDPIAAAAPEPADDPKPAEAPKQVDDEPGFAPPSDVMPSESPAAPAPEEPEPANEDEDDDAPPPDIEADPKKANAWTKIRSEKKELKLENAELKKQLEQVKTSVTDGEVAQRIEQLEQQVEQYEERLGQHDVTQTASFNERYTAPLVARYKRVVGLLTKATGDAAAADAVARKLLDPSANRDEMIAEYPITTQAALGAMLVEVDDLQEQRDKAIADWRDTKAAMAEQETRQGISTLNKSIVQDTGKAVEALRLEGNWLYMISESDDQWNKAVKDRITTLQGTLKSGTPEDMVKLVADGLTARTYREWYEKEHKRAEKLAAQINAKLRSAPDIGSSSSPAEPLPKPTKPRSLAKGLDDIWGKDESF